MLIQLNFVCIICLFEKHVNAFKVIGRFYFKFRLFDKQFIIFMYLKCSFRSKTDILCGTILR